jgi:hypothetical protein
VYPFTNSDYIRHVPNYTRAHDVDSVDVEQLDRDTFLRQSTAIARVSCEGRRPDTDRHARKWQSPEYLKAACGSATVRVFHQPRPERERTRCKRQLSGGSLRNSLLRVRF